MFKKRQDPGLSPGPGDYNTYSSSLVRRGQKFNSVRRTNTTFWIGTEVRERTHLGQSKGSR